MFESTLKCVAAGVGAAYPCAAVAIGQGHEVFVRSFFGQRQELPTALPITEDTLFDLASVSKLVSTTMVALKMIENKKMSPDDTVGTFIDFAGAYSDLLTFAL